MRGTGKKKLTLIALVMLVFGGGVFPVMGQSGRRKIDNSRYLTDAEFMPGVPCAEKIGQLLDPVGKVSRQRFQKLLNDLVLCEGKEGGAYAALARQMYLGRVEVRSGNYFMGWEHFRMGGERLHELPADAPLKQQYLLMKGNAYQETGASALSMPFYREALDMHFRRKEPIPTNILNIFHKLAIAHYELEDVDSALYFERAAINHYENEPQSLWYPSAINNLGLMYEKIGATDSALFYYDMAREVIEKDPVGKGNLLGSVLDNLGNIYEQKSDFHTALQYFRQSYEVGLENHKRSRIIQGGAKSATMLMRIGTSEEGATLEAQKMMAEVDSFLVQLGRDRLGRRYSHYLEAKMLMAVDDLPAYDAAFKAYVAHQDSLDVIANDRRIRAMEDFFLSSEQRYSEQLELAGRETLDARENVRYLVIIGALLLLILLALVWFFRQRNLQQGDQIRLSEATEQVQQLHLENAALKKRELEQQLQFRKQDVTDLTLEMNIRNKARQDLVVQLESILKAGSPTLELRRLLNDLKREVNEERETEALIGDHEMVNNEFSEKLISRFPGLTRTERELCELFVLDLPVKEIANLRKITAQSVRMGKYRLRKTLGLETGHDLVQFLKQL